MTDGLVADPSRHSPYQVGDNFDLTFNADGAKGPNGLTPDSSEWPPDAYTVLVSDPSLVQCGEKELNGDPVEGVFDFFVACVAVKPGVETFRVNYYVDSEQQQVQHVVTIKKGAN